jgi:hypothetical protein
LHPLIILAVILAFLLLILEILERITDFIGTVNKISFQKIQEK